MTAGRRQLPWFPSNSSFFFHHINGSPFKKGWLGWISKSSRCLSVAEIMYHHYIPLRTSSVIKYLTFVPSPVFFCPSIELPLEFFAVPSVSARRWRWMPREAWSQFQCGECVRGAPTSCYVLFVDGRNPATVTTWDVQNPINNGAGFLPHSFAASSNVGEPNLREEWVRFWVGCSYFFGAIVLWRVGRCFGVFFWVSQQNLGIMIQFGVFNRLDSTAT